MPKGHDTTYGGPSRLQSFCFVSDENMVWYNRFCVCVEFEMRVCFFLWMLRVCAKRNLETGNWAERKIELVISPSHSRTEEDVPS